MLPEHKARARGDDEPVLPQELAAWRRAASAYLHAAATAPEGADGQARRARVASYHWLVALDAGLQQATGAGLARFRVCGVAAATAAPAGGRWKAGVKTDRLRSRVGRRKCVREAGRE